MEEEELFSRRGEPSKSCLRPTEKRDVHQKAKWQYAALTSLSFVAEAMMAAERKVARTLAGATGLHETMSERRRPPPTASNAVYAAVLSATLINLRRSESVLSLKPRMRRPSVTVRQTEMATSTAADAQSHREAVLL